MGPGGLLVGHGVRPGGGWQRRGYRPSEYTDRDGEDTRTAQKAVGWAQAAGSRLRFQETSRFLFRQVESIHRHPRLKYPKPRARSALHSLSPSPPVSHCGLPLEHPQGPGPTHQEGTAAVKQRQTSPSPRAAAGRGNSFVSPRRLTGGGCPLLAVSTPAVRPQRHSAQRRTETGRVGAGGCLGTNKAREGAGWLGHTARARRLVWNLRAPYIVAVPLTGR